MRGRSSQVLVIDASVARAAGDTEHPVSSACRKYLLAVLEICHKVAVTSEMKKEWQRHQSRFTRKWQRSMAARKKPLRDIEPQPAGIDLQALEPSQRAIVEKDLCLLEAALAADQVIVTCDDALQKTLGKSPQGKGLLDRITWHNPVTDGTERLRKKAK